MTVLHGGGRGAAGEGGDPAGKGGSLGEELAGDFLDELMPENLDWLRLVRAFPKTALVLAAAGGYLLGRTRGREILTALSLFAAQRVARNINELLGEEVL